MREEPLFADLRYFPISRFRSYAVFYHAIEDGIEVLRILHGARDIPAILIEELSVDDLVEGTADAE